MWIFLLFLGIFVTYVILHLLQANLLTKHGFLCRTLMKILYRFVTVLGVWELYIHLCLIS
jgi:hypothetical protein